MSRSKNKPTFAALAAAHGKRVPDLVRPELDVLFVGINPSLYSAAVGHHFARPGNRFWKALHGAGLSARLLDPSEERELLGSGIGITNVVPRATASAAELAREQYLEGAAVLAKKVRRFRPRIVAFLGIGAYRIATGKRDATVGAQPEGFAGTRAFVLPNPSGLNAHYQLDDLVREYAKLREAVGKPSVPHNRTSAKR